MPQILYWTEYTEYVISGLSGMTHWMSCIFVWQFHLLNMCTAGNLALRIQGKAPGGIYQLVKGMIGIPK